MRAKFLSVDEIGRHRVGVRLAVVKYADGDSDPRTIRPT